MKQCDGSLGWCWQCCAVSTGARGGIGGGNTNMEARESLGGADGRISVGVRAVFGQTDAALVTAFVNLLCDPEPGALALRK